jgi:hypothetical protein
VKRSALLSVCFCAGLLGAIASLLVAWLCSSYGLTELADVTWHINFSIGKLYPHMVWGGLWGLLYALTVIHPRTRKHWVRKGIIVSLLPTLYHLFVVFPYQTGYGMLGINLGLLTPLFVFLYNLVWGTFTGFFSRLLWGKA